MRQIFPKPYRFATHKISENDTRAKPSYPQNQSAINNTPDILLAKDLEVIIVEESVGDKNEWHKVFQANDETESELYVKKENLIPLIKKVYQEVDTAKTLQPSVTSPTITWYNNEPYIPFKDAKKGVYSVVIESEFTSIISDSHLEIISKKAFYEGIQIIFRNKGFNIIQKQIAQNLEKYFTFGSVDEFYVDSRSCLPVKFLVSFPMRFLGKQNFNKSPKNKEFQTAKYEVVINPINFQLKVNKLLAAFKSFEDQIADYLSPNGVITGYITEYELLNIKRFVNQFIKLTSETDFPFNENDNVNYILGFDEDYELKYLLRNDQNIAEDEIINSYRFREPLNTKRTVYYFINIDKITRFYSEYKLQEFITEFVKFPTPEFKKIDLAINNLNISKDDVEKFKKIKDELKKECVSFSPSKIFADGVGVSDLYQTIQKAYSTRNEIPSESRTKDDLISAKEKPTCWAC